LKESAARTTLSNVTKMVTPLLIPNLMAAYRVGGPRSLAWQEILRQNEFFGNLFPPLCCKA
jgi:hypothetical protein